MATNPPKGPGRIGSVRNRVQVFNPKTKRWVKIDNESKLFMDQASAKYRKFKGVRKNNFKCTRTGEMTYWSLDIEFL